MARQNRYLVDIRASPSGEPNKCSTQQSNPSDYPGEPFRVRKDESPTIKALRTRHATLRALSITRKGTQVIVALGARQADGNTDDRRFSPFLSGYALARRI